VPREAVEACVEPGRRELPPVAGLSYHAFVDPSGGSQDAMTLAIAHYENGRVILDALRERRPPFSPEDVVGEHAELLKVYRVPSVTGDRFGGEWPRERFRAHGFSYRVAEKVKSDLYRELLPTLNSNTVELLDHPRLLAQLCGLERRTARGGRDSIDHAPGGHDDLANAVAGAVGEASRVQRYDEDNRPEGYERWDRLEREEALAELPEIRQKALALGIPEATIRRLEEEVGIGHLASYLQELLNENTLQGRLRRAGLVD